MFIDQINLNNIRVFECVYRLQSMTKAADELHITQSGVSQHIKGLEEILNIKLFDRIKQKLVPTQTATELFKRWSKDLYSIEQSLIDIKGDKFTHVGKIKIGCPIEFGNNIVLPLLVKFAQQHPEIRFQVQYGFASQMNDMLLNGDLDFAFLDSYAIDRQITTKKVYDEIWDLCISKKAYQKLSCKKEDKSFFEKLDYIAYLEGEPILKMWFKHHFKFINLKMQIRANLMDVQGIERLILNDLGAGIVPRYHLLKVDKKQSLFHVFQGSGKPLTNAISLAYVETRTRVPSVQALIKFLIEEL